jgi:hypothetical protein
MMLSEFQRDQLLLNCDRASAELSSIAEFYPSIVDACRILIQSAADELMRQNIGSEHQGCKPCSCGQELLLPLVVNDKVDILAVHSVSFSRWIILEN